MSSERLFVVFRRHSFSHVSVKAMSKFVVLWCSSVLNFRCIVQQHRRFESNRVESSRFVRISGRPIRVLTLFFSKSPANRLPLSRIDYSTDDSSRIESNRVDSSKFLAALFAFLSYFFLSPPQIDFRLVESSTAQTIRVESSRIVKISGRPIRVLVLFFSKSPANRLPLSRIVYSTDDSSRIESNRQNFWPPYSRSCPIFF